MVFAHVLTVICKTNVEEQQSTSPVSCRELHMMIPSSRRRNIRSMIDRASTESHSSICMMTAVFYCIGPGGLSTKRCIILVKSCAVQKLGTVEQVTSLVCVVAIGHCAV